VEVMGAAEMTMDAIIAAIMAILHESRTLLASYVQRFRVKEQEGQVATAPSFATTATSLLVLDRVREQLESKSSSTSITSTHLVMADGALHADVSLAPVTPKRCSTLCSDVNVANTLDAVMFPTSGAIHMPSTRLPVGKNVMLQGAGVCATNTPADCSSHVLTGP
jgi:hypothetical protein